MFIKKTKRTSSLKSQTKALFLALLILLVATGIFLTKAFLPEKAKSFTNFTSAYIEMENSRFSYRAGVTSGTAGNSDIAIDTTDDTNKNGDINTNHLFPNDAVCFTPSVLLGCTDDIEYTVANIIDTDEFNVSPPITSSLEATDYVIASQSGQIKLHFTTTTAIPANGDLILTLPAVKEAGKTNDHFPDTADTIANNGFDLNGITAADITVAGCTDGDWVATETITAGNGTTDHTIQIDRQNTACDAESAITVTIDSDPGIINPAPVNGDAHTQGHADIYNVNVLSRNGAGDTLDESDIKVAPIEAVLISATVDETLSFTIAGITDDSSTYCGATRTVSSPDSTATSITWGTTLSPTYLEATHNAQQKASITTNAISGYKVYIEENDQMGRNGNVCTGATPGADGYTFTAGTCIRDTACGSTSCTHVDAYDWGADPSSFPGLGYSLQNDGADTSAKFVYNSGASPCDATAGAGNFCAKQFADIEAAENPMDAGAEIMTSSGPVDDSSVFVCFRIDIVGTQPSGYYYNKISYTAVPVF